MSDEIQTTNTSDGSTDAAAPRYQHDYPTRVLPMQKDVHGKPCFESYLTPSSYCVRSEAPLPPHLPGVIIFVHGVNSEGEWYDAAEMALCKGLNERLNRTDLKENRYRDEDPTTRKKIPREIDPDWNGRSPVIRFYWGYRAPGGQEKKWRIALKNERGTDFWNQKGAEQPGPWYWGGGPFANGTNNLQQLWSKEGTKRHVAGFFDVQLFNPEWDRELHDCPPRDYYAHAAERLASLVDDVRREHPDDTVTIMSHSQGTMIALAATALCKERAPDSVLVMNSPFALDDKITDYLTCGNTRPTTGARARTFKAIAQRIGKDKKVLGPDQLKRLQVGATADMDFWKPDVALPNGVSERDNHGRLYVYFCPHDRVMGTKPLQSIGWQGIDDKLLAELGDTVKQRMLARGTACGDEPGVRNFGKLPPIPDPMKKPERPVEPHIEPPRTPNDFWNGNKTVLGAPLWVVPDENQTVTINAERVPNPITAEEMSQPMKYDEHGVAIYFDRAPQTMPPWGEIDPDNGEYVEPDFPNFASIYQRQKYMERADVYAPTGKTRTLESDSELQTRIAGYRPMPTNHSSLPQHEAFMRRVAAYDLPVGFCDSYESPEFWGKLIHKADWTHYGEDPYFMSGELAVPKQPAGIDGETVAEEASKADAEQRRWRGA
ncbi:hypothetical protein [Paraburkholderia sp. SIMBA_030]|uniref:T6SS effector phospholipase Tle3 domain-containing protein n=2 Tax=Bacteria TaxID=2 RepID=UPI00397CA784